MREAIINQVDAFSEEMQLHYACPNRTLIVEIMQYDASGLASLLKEDLSRYVFVLGQYLVMLQHNENLCRLEVLLATSSFEYQLNCTKLRRDDIEGKTVKERDTWVLMTFPEMKKLYEEKLALEAKEILIHGMVKSVEGLLNALKKELSSKYGD